MSVLIVEDVEKGKFQDGELNDVTFLYVCVSEPKEKFESEDLEYSVKCVVDKQTAEAWKDKFPKNKPNSVATSKFHKTFKVDPPYPDQEDQYILLVKVAAQDDQGELFPDDAFKRPKVYTPSSKGVKNITKSTLVANGSKGDVYFWVNNNKFGSFPMLNEILVRELIVYEGRAEGQSRWGSVVDDSDSPDSPEEPRSGRFSSQEKEEAPELIDEDKEF